MLVAPVFLSRPCFLPCGQRRRDESVCVLFQLLLLRVEDFPQILGLFVVAAVAEDVIVPDASGLLGKSLGMDSPEGVQPMDDSAPPVGAFFFPALAHRDSGWIKFSGVDEAGVADTELFLGAAPLFSIAVQHGRAGMQGVSAGVHHCFGESFYIGVHDQSRCLGNFRPWALGYFMPGGESDWRAVAVLWAKHQIVTHRLVGAAAVEAGDFEAVRHFGHCSLLFSFV